MKTIIPFLLFWFVFFTIGFCSVAVSNNYPFSSKRNFVRNKEFQKKPDSPIYIYNITGHSIMAKLAPNDTAQDEDEYPSGARLVLLDKLQGWYKVKWEDASGSYVRVGFIRKKYLGPKSAIKPERAVYCLTGKRIYLKAKPSVSSDDVSECLRGTRLVIIIETKGWYYVEQDNMEKGFIQKKETGSLQELRVLSRLRTLKIVSDIEVNGQSVYSKDYPGRYDIDFHPEEDDIDDEGDSRYIIPDSILDKYIDITLINQQEYDLNKRKSRIYYYLNDSLFRKKDGALLIPTKKGTTIYTDVSAKDFGENASIYEYVGQYPFINKYIMSGSFYFSCEYWFLDKTTGLRDTNASFLEFPFVSKDKKYIATLSFPEEESNAILTIYKMKNDEPRPYFGAEFLTWGPVYDVPIQKIDMFWVNGHTLYVKTMSPNLNEEDQKKNGYEYLKIRIK